MQPPLFWISACLNGEIVELLWTTEISQGSGCPVWDCRIGCDGRLYDAVLKIYKPNFDDSSGLGPVATVEKHALALAEFAQGEQISMDERRRLLLVALRLLPFAFGERIIDPIKWQLSDH